MLVVDLLNRSRFGWANWRCSLFAVVVSIWLVRILMGRGDCNARRAVRGVKALADALENHRDTFDLADTFE